MIRDILTGWEAAPSAPGAMAKVRDVYAEKLESTRAQVARLLELERELAELQSGMTAIYGKGQYCPAAGSPLFGKGEAAPAGGGDTKTRSIPAGSVR